MTDEQDNSMPDTPDDGVTAEQDEALDAVREAATAPISELESIEDELRALLAEDMDGDVRERIAGAADAVAVAISNLAGLF